jgi:hypothetical protein
MLADRSRNRVCLLATVLALGISSCKSDEVEEQPPGSCVERDKKYSIDASFPVGMVRTRNVVECVPTCGADENVDGFLSVTALPAGKCSSQGECEFGAYSPCPCDRKTGPVNDYRCICNHGVWACEIAAYAASACLPCEPDAG